MSTHVIPVGAAYCRPRSGGRRAIDLTREAGGQDVRAEATAEEAGDEEGGEESIFGGNQCGGSRHADRKV
jgi:hypothetical protein